MRRRMWRRSTHVVLVLIGGFALVMGTGLAAPVHSDGGELDTGFGGGVVTLAAARGLASSVAPQADGSIITSGYTLGSDNLFHFTLARFDNYGQPVPPLDGKRPQPAIGPGDDIAVAVAVQTDGRIVVAGYTQLDTQRSAILVRYNRNGTSDDNFGNNGIVRLQAKVVPLAVMIMADRTIIVAASYSTPGTESKSIALMRFLSEGQPDPGFGTDGIAPVSVSASGDVATLSVGENSREVILTVANTGGVSAVRLDMTNEQSPVVSVSPPVPFLPPMREGVNGIAVTKSHKFLLAGVAETCFAVARYSDDGTLDTTFASGGVSTEVGGDAAYAVAEQDDGNIVAAGSSSDSFVVARFKGDTTATATATDSPTSVSATATSATPTMGVTVSPTSAPSTSTPPPLTATPPPATPATTRSPSPTPAPIVNPQPELPPGQPPGTDSR